MISGGGLQVKQVFTDPFFFLAYGFGSGLAPRAPGTFGSLAAIPIAILLMTLDWRLHALIVAVVFGAGVYICDRVAKKLAVEDPSGIVLDEFVGLWIACLFVPLTWYYVLFAFLAFRFFDVLKPWPVSWLDKNIKGGLGIMLDDVAAGLYALCAVQLCVFGVSEFM